jgi:hypothetical protein
MKMSKNPRIQEETRTRKLTPFQKDIGYVGMLVFSGLMFVMSLMSAYSSGDLLLGIFAFGFGAFTVLMVFTLTTEKSDGRT